MSTNTQIEHKDWWRLFTHMSEKKLKIRHRESIDKYPTDIENEFYIQAYGTEFVQIDYQFDISDRLIEQVAKWGENRRIIKKIGISQSDSDVVQLKHLLLGRASQFIEYSSKSDHPQAEDALWAIKEVFDVRWSKKSFVAPIFYNIWGWLQLELGKEGEKQMPRTQRHERQLSEYSRINNYKVLNIEYDSQKNVRYLIRDGIRHG